MEKLIELVKRVSIEEAAPKVASGAVFLVLFSIVFVTNIVTCVYYNQLWFLSAWSIGLGLEIIGYGGRIWWAQQNDSLNAYVMMLVCVTIAPCFMMLCFYYIMAQMVLVYGNNFSKLRSTKYYVLFIIWDLISLVLQAAGSGASTGADDDEPGRYVLIAGLAIQVASMIIFQYFWYTFLWEIYKSYKEYGDQFFNPSYTSFRTTRKYLNHFLIGVSVALFLIFFRTFYRMIAAGDGYESYPQKNELYFDIMEGLMTALAAIIMAVLSPGFVYGKAVNLSVKKVGYENNRVDEIDYSMGMTKINSYES